MFTSSIETKDDQWDRILIQVLRKEGGQVSLSTIICERSGEAVLQEISLPLPDAVGCSRR